MHVFKMRIKTQSSIKKTQLLCAFVLEDSNKIIGLPKFDTKDYLSLIQKHHLQSINL